MDTKIKLKESRLLDWMFSDADDLKSFAKLAIEELYTKGRTKWTVQGILDGCGYIPGYICEDGEHGAEYDPSDIELITDREIEVCYKCGHEYDESMSNFCSNCLAVQ